MKARVICMNISAFQALARLADSVPASPKLKRCLLQEKALSLILADVERMIGGTAQDSAFFLSETQHKKIVLVLSERRQKLNKINNKGIAAS